MKIFFAIFYCLVKVTLLGLCFSLLTACGSNPVWLAPAESITYSPDREVKKSIPIMMLGDEVERRYQSIGHIILATGGIIKDTLPLNHVGKISQEYQKKLIHVAKKIGADAVIGVTEVGYYGFSTAGQSVNGIAVRYIDESSDISNTDNHSDFIACLLPLVSSDETNEDAIEFDRDVRIIARRYLIFKGYYVLTPLETMFNDHLNSFQMMSNRELDGLCGLESDLFVVLQPLNNSKDLTISIFSKKEKRFNIKESEERTASGFIMGNWLSGGLIGAGIAGLFSDSFADEDMIKKLIDFLPDIYVSEKDLEK